MGGERAAEGGVNDGDLRRVAEAGLLHNADAFDGAESLRAGLCPRKRLPQLFHQRVMSSLDAAQTLPRPGGTFLSFLHALSPLADRASYSASRCGLFQYYD